MLKGIEIRLEAQHIILLKRSMFFVKILIKTIRPRSLPVTFLNGRPYSLLRKQIKEKVTLIILKPFELVVELFKLGGKLY